MTSNTDGSWFLRSLNYLRYATLAFLSLILIFFINYIYPAVDEID